MNDFGGFGGEQSPSGMTFTLFIEEFDTIINQLRVDLQGYFVNEQGAKIELHEPSMNDLGVSFIISTLRQNINKNLFLTTLTKEQIRKIGMNTGFTICKTLYWNAEKYDLKPEMYESIVQACNNIVFFALHRALNGAERGMIGKTVSEHVVSEHRHDEEKKGGLPIPNLFK